MTDGESGLRVDVSNLVEEKKENKRRDEKIEGGSGSGVLVHQS